MPASSSKLINETYLMMDVVTPPSALSSILNRHPIYDCLFAHMSPVSMARMGQVCREVRTTTTDYATRAYNINRRLSHFFNDPLAFRSLMARTRMVISGSFAIQFFGRTQYHGSDLDLYVHRDHTILEVGALLKTEGYEYIPFKWQEATLAGELQRITDHPGYGSEDIEEAERLYSEVHVRSICSFVRRSVSGDVERTIQVMISRHCPMATILDFHSSCVMNIITYNAAYALFPQATFEEHTALILNSNTPHALDALKKYSARGFRLIEQETAHLHPHLVAAFFMNQPRWVSDEHSWIIPLDTQGVIPPPPPSPVSAALAWDPIAECGWSLSAGTDSPHVVVRSADIRLPLLRWRYTWPMAGMEYRMLEELKGPGGKKMYPMGMGAWRQRDTSRDDTQWHDAQMPTLRQKCTAQLGQGGPPKQHGCYLAY